MTRERGGAWAHYALERTRIDAQPGPSAVIAAIDVGGAPRGCCP